MGKHISDRPIYHYQEDGIRARAIKETKTYITTLRLLDGKMLNTKY
jgi:hypothetical protein